MSTRSFRAPSRTSTRTTSSKHHPPPPHRTPSRTATTSHQDEEEWVVALLEGRGTGREVGVVCVEKDLGKVVLTQFGDSSTFVKTLHLLLTFPPSLLLVPSSSLGPTSTTTFKSSNQSTQSTGGRETASQLVQMLREAEASKNVPIVGVHRKLWDEQAGFEFLSALTLDDDQRICTIRSAKSKYYALAATSALFKYLEKSHSLIFPPRSLRIGYVPLGGTCMIDTDTANNLELVSNVVDKGSKQHLLGMLNKCFTPMGTRLLRTNILSPLTDVKVIDTRLDAVEELINAEDRFTSLRKALSSFPLKSLDIDKLISSLLLPSPTPSSDPSSQTTRSLTLLLSLRHLLISLPSILSSLKGVESTLLRTVEKILKDQRREEVLEWLKETLNEEVFVEGCDKEGGGGGKGGLKGKNSRIYAVRAEKRLLLDVARETYKENLNDAFELCDVLSKEHNLDMNLSFQGGIFVFTCLNKDVEEREGGKLPSVFLHVNKKGKKVEFSSMELKKSNSRIAESVQEILIMSNDILDELFDKLRGSIACLYRCSEAIAMLDMLSSFAEVANKNNYVRPEWTDTLAIKSGRNPLHEEFRLSDGSFVPNDTYASKSASFQIVTGSNMSGKSTLLRQIALLHILAQIGSYVPATYASFHLIDALLSRLSNDDSIESNLSTFASEMSTMAMINAALSSKGGGGFKHCLVVVDELGRGTSPEEGVGIAAALGERIVRAKATCFFATHFGEMAHILSRHPNVVSLHLETSIDRSQPDFSLTFHHRVVDGTTPLTHYGLELAKIAKLPSQVLKRSNIVSNALSSLAEEGRKKAVGTKIAVRRRELLRLRTQLRELKDSRGLSGGELMERLKELQREMVGMLSATRFVDGEERGGEEEKEDMVVKSKEEEEESDGEEEDEHEHEAAAKVHGSESERERSESILPMEFE